MFNHDSEFRTKKFFFQTLINRIINCKSKILIIKQGYRDWSYAEDIINAIILIMRQKKSSEYIINSGKLVSTTQIAKRACVLLNKKIKISSLSNQEDKLKIKGDNSKLLSLGFKTNFSLDNIILNILKS